MPGRAFRKFGIAGTGDMVLENLDQPTAKVSIAGSGSIKADGKVDEIEIHIAGSGDADLGKVEARNAKVHIAGSGDVNLHSRPRKVESHIAGSGRIRNVSEGI